MSSEKGERGRRADSRRRGAAKLARADIGNLLSSVVPEIPNQSPFKAYLISNLHDGSQYVGITERRLVDRWRSHIYAAQSGRGYFLHDAIRAFGPENFRCTHIASAKNRYQLGELEKQLIEQYGTVEHGYNRTRGGVAGETVGSSVEVDGQHYISVNAAARAYGIPEFSVHQRLNRYGWTLRQALDLDTPPVHLPSHRKPYEVAKKSYPSFMEACRAYSLEEGCVRSRFKCGWSKWQAFGLSPPPKKARNYGKPLTVAGRTFSNIAAAAEAFDLSPRLIAGRLRSRGAKWTPEQAVGLKPPPPRKPTKTTPIDVDGKPFESITEAANSLGFKPALITSRLAAGWSVDQAFELASGPPPSGEKNGQEITVGGVTFQSRAKAAEAYELDPRIVHKRLNQLGWALEQAFGLLPPPEKPGNHRKPIIVGEREYQSVEAACTHLEVNPGKIWGRLRRDWTPNEAFGVVDRKPRTRSS